MVIGIDASRLESETKTGVEWYVYFLLLELKKVADPKIRVILYSRQPLSGPFKHLPKNWENKVLRWPPKRLWTQLRLSWEMFRRSPNVLFIPAHVFPLIRPKKTIMTVHDVAAAHNPEAFSWFEKWYSLWSAKFASLYLWKVIVPSEFTKNELLDLLTEKKHLDTQHIEPIVERMHVVHHGFDKKYGEYHDARRSQDVLDTYGIQKPYLLSVGRLESKKNTVQIIESFEKLCDRLGQKDLQLVLVGKPGFGYEKVEEVLETCKYRMSIILPGWVPQDDMPTLYQSAEVFLFPSSYEGFGIPLLESFASKTPVIASNLDVLQEVGGDAAVYVDFADSEAIARSLEGLLKIDTLKSEKVRLGLERTKIFSWKKSAQTTWSILTSEL